MQAINSVKHDEKMKMNKTLALLVAVSVGFAASSYAADNTYDFSAQFPSGGPLVTGVLTGTPSGNFVDNVNVLSLDINGTPVSGTIYTATWSGGWAADPVVSFTGTDNNFIFINSDIVNGNYSFSAYFYIQPSSVASSLNVPISQAYDGPYYNDYSTATENTWSLTLVDSVPDGASTAMLCGMSLVVLGLLRRKLA